MVHQELEQAFKNCLFHKSGMIKNSLDNYFGKYNNNILEESEKYLIIGMTPQSFTKKLKPLKVKFEFGVAKKGVLKKIENIVIL